MHKIIFYIWNKLPIIFLIPFLPISGIFYLIITLRKYFLVRIFSKFTSKSKLIIVGNLNVGGSGKTPFTIWLTNYLKKRGKKIIIVSSGYGSNVSKPQLVSLLSNPINVGDEAILLHKQTNVDVVTSNNRVKSTMFCDHHGADYIIHDDGLQHYSLDRQYEFIVTMHNSNHNNLLLPCGPLREPKSFHPNACYIHSNYSGNEVPGFYSKITNIRSGFDGHIFDINDKKFSHTTLITGIADNTNLKKELNLLGITFKSIKFPDHYQFNQKDIPDVDNPILVTEKDFVKMNDFNCNNIYILEHSVIPNAKLLELVERL